MKTILNVCKVRSCMETHTEDSDLCTLHKGKCDRIEMETEIKRLRVKIATINRRNKMILAGLSPTPLRNVWVVEGSSWIYT